MTRSVPSRLRHVVISSRDRRVSPLVRQYVQDKGWHISILWQPPWLFPDDGRRLKRCSIPSDPWFCHLSDSPDLFGGKRCVSGAGATADEAVLAAIPPDLLAAIKRLERAVDNLRDCLQK